MTAFGGSGSEFPQAIAVDRNGATYISGATTSIDFPVSPDAAVGQFEPKLPATPISFIAVLNPSGNSLTYASYGEPGEVSAAVGLDSFNNVYLSGNSGDGSFWVRKYLTHGPVVVYDRKIAPGGVTSFSPTLFAVDEAGNATIMSVTQALSFPVYQANEACHMANMQVQDGFLIRLSSLGELIQSTYLPSGTTPYAMAVSSQGGYVAGTDGSQFTIFALASRTVAEETPISFGWVVSSFLCKHFSV